MNTIEIGFLIYFSILIFLWIWKVELSFEKGSLLYFLQTLIGSSENHISRKDHISAINTNRSNYFIISNRKKIIKEILKWGFNNISYQNINTSNKIAVNLEVRYYKHSKRWGCFNASQNKITIHVNRIDSIERIVYVVLHELIHKYQHQSDPKNFIGKYNTLLAQKTYDKHPMEIEANAISMNQLERCIQFLLDNNLIKKY